MKQSSKTSDFLFQNLRVYQQALMLAEQVSAATAGFLRTDRYVADQLNRASLSIALNIAESTGRATQADRRRFLFMARGSLHECVALLDLCKRKNLVPTQSRAALTQQLVTVAKMLSGMLARPADPDAVREVAGGRLCLTSRRRLSVPPPLRLSPLRLFELQHITQNGVAPYDPP